MLITASIVLYKTSTIHLNECLRSLELCRPKIHLFIVDNSPTDELRTSYQTVLQDTYIHLPKNPGYGSGHNTAIRLSQLIGSEYHLVINADVKFYSDVLSPMLTYMQSHVEVGHMMPKVLGLDGSIQRLCKLVPTPIDLLARLLPLGFLVASTRRRFELINGPTDEIIFSPYLSGCFMLFRQSTLREVGLFDERFFMYPEDIDLTRRIAERYLTLYFPKVEVIHHHAAESRKSLRMFVIHVVNIVRYFNKWGWIYDAKRSMLNNQALRQFKTNI